MPAIWSIFFKKHIRYCRWRARCAIRKRLPRRLSGAPCVAVTGVTSFAANIPLGGSSLIFTAPKQNCASKSTALPILSQHKWSTTLPAQPGWKKLIAKSSALQMMISAIISMRLWIISSKSLKRSWFPHPDKKVGGLSSPRPAPHPGCPGGQLPGGDQRAGVTRK